MWRVRRWRRRGAVALATAELVRGHVRVCRSNTACVIGGSRRPPPTRIPFTLPTYPYPYTLYPPRSLPL